MSNREATDTITGYFYQFDKTILEILSQSDCKNLVVVEGIEDIDINTKDEIKAIQCKYYSKTKYSNSVIKKPIILMLRHFSENYPSNIKYHIYGHYKSGQEKYSKLSIESLKNNFLTYTKTEKDKKGERIKVTHRVYEELGLDDNNLLSFLSLLSIDVHAPSIEDQYKKIIINLEKNLNVSHLEAEDYHYNSALKLIKNLSIQQSRDERSITKEEFIRKIKDKDKLFDSWFIARKGRNNYISMIKREKLSIGLNIEIFDRFFLIDCRENVDFVLIKEIIFRIADKWSKISKRQKPSFCPSIYLHGIDERELIDLKNKLYEENFFFVDGCPFLGAKFFLRHYFTEPTVENGIRFRFVDTLEILDNVLNSTNKTVELYQFYIVDTFFDFCGVKSEKIKVVDLDYIKDMVR